jgi:flagellin-like protein
MQIKQTLKEFVSGNDRAVSPVIGVILMVAITVILAAVIGTFVLGLGDSVQSNVQAGASVQATVGDSSSNPGTITVTFNSNQNADNLEVRVGNGASAVGSPDATTLSSVGESVTFSEADGSSADEDNDVQIIVVAVGESSDTTTVIVDKTVTI